MIYIGSMKTVKHLSINMVQLTDPAMLERVNGFLSENPNLLETDKYIVLHSLLGRDLYEEQQFVPKVVIHKGHCGEMRNSGIDVLLD